MTRRAECSCGRLSATCEGEPLRVSVCHCLACKRRTGSAFSWQARWPEEAVRVEGEWRAFERRGDEGSLITYRFCPTCGRTILYANSDLPGMVAVPAGGFADAGFPPPTRSVYDPGRRCAWVDLLTEPLDRL